MKIKAFIISIIILISATLSGCSYNDYQENLKLFREFIQKIMYFYQGDGGTGGGDNQNQETKPQNQDYLLEFKTAIKSGSHFTLTKTAQTEYNKVYEEVFFTGEYLYKTTKLASSITVVSHKLFLPSGETYSYNGTTITKDKPEDFTAIKTQILNDLFSDSIVWVKEGERYLFQNGDFTYLIQKGETDNSIKYEIRYNPVETWAIYKGEVTLYNSLIVDIPQPLQEYI